MGPDWGWLRRVMSALKLAVDPYTLGRHARALAGWFDPFWRVTARRRVRLSQVGQLGCTPLQSHAPSIATPRGAAVVRWLEGGRLWSLWSCLPLTMLA